MTVLVAGLVDRLLGEIPAFHPVVAMGRWLGWSGRWTRTRHRPATAFLAGGVAWTAGAAAVLLAAALLDRATAPAPGWMRWSVRGLALSTLGSGRLLRDEVAAVEAALVDGAEAGGEAVRRLVSRDVTDLDATGVRQAALESLAENASDSVLAPLLWYVVAGLPGAALYRYANTADAMWGYHGRWEWAGKVAARADDAANLIPARLTGALVAAVPGHRPTIGWTTVRAEGRRTPSPNAGYPMAALALRLGVRLEKRGAYVLNPDGREPTADDTAAALRLVGRAMVAAVLVAALAEALLDRAETAVGPG